MTVTADDVYDNLLYLESLKLGPAAVDGFRAKFVTFPSNLLKVKGFFTRSPSHSVERDYTVEAAV